MPLKGTFTPASLTARWKLHPGTLANWRSQGRGPAFRKTGPHRTAKIVYPIARTLRWGRSNGYET